MTWISFIGGALLGAALGWLLKAAIDEARLDRAASREESWKKKARLAEARAVAMETKARVMDRHLAALRQAQAEEDKLDEIEGSDLGDCLDGLFNGLRGKPETD